MCEYYDPTLSDLIRSGTAKWRSFSNGNKLTFCVFKQLPWYSYNRLKVEQSILSIRSPFVDNDLLRIMYSAPEDKKSGLLITLWLISDGNPDVARIMTDLGVSYPKSPVWPFVRAYREFAFKMEYFANHGMPRFAASIDKKMGPLSIENIFIGKNKYYHLRRWFRDELSGYVREIALDESTLKRGHLNRKITEKAILAHLSGRENHTQLINQVITVELIHRLILNN
jgi:asparagine synthase (glutamine-hydrolysing)